MLYRDNKITRTSNEESKNKYQSQTLCVKHPTIFSCTRQASRSQEKDEKH